MNLLKTVKDSEMKKISNEDAYVMYAMQLQVNHHSLIKKKEMSKKKGRHAEFGDKNALKFKYTCFFGYMKWQ